MKKFNLLRSLAVVVAATAAFYACDKSDETDPTPAPSDPGSLLDLKAETIVVNGKEFSVGSALLADPHGEGNVRIVFSPEADMNEAFIQSVDHVAVEIASEFVGKEVDFTAKSGVYAIEAMWSDPSIYLDATNEYPDDTLTEGKCLINPKEDGYELFLKFNADGVEFAARTTVAGNEDGEGGNDLEQLAEDTIVLGDETLQVKSKVATDYEGGIYIAASAEAGITSLYDMEEYFGIYVAPSLVGEEFDLKTESRSYSVAVLIGDHYCDPSTGFTDDITEGKCLVRKNSEEEYEAFVTFTTTEGITYSLRTKAPYTPGEQYDSLFCYSADGAEDPVRAAFYLAEDGTHYLYLTSGNVDYYSEMESNAYYYAAIVLTDDQLTGQPTALSLEDCPMAGIYTNLPEKQNEWGAFYLFATGGTVTATRNGEGNYTVKLDCSFEDGSTLRVEYEGDFKSQEIEPEDEYSNTFTYQGATALIQSVYIEKNSDTKWTVYVCDTKVSSFEECKANDPVILVIPPLTEEEQTFGFSQYDSVMQFSYKDRTWNPGTDTGNVTGYLVGSELVMTFNTFEGTDGLSGEYKGEVQFAN